MVNFMTFLLQTTNKNKIQAILIAIFCILFGFQGTSIAQTLIRQPGFEVSRQQAYGISFAVVKLDPQEVKLRLYWRIRGKSFLSLNYLQQQLRTKNITLLAAMNAGIFEKSFQPLGLHIENGQQLRQLNTRSGYGNFYLQPNGVFLLQDNKASIVSTQSYASGGFRPQLATQSGPILLENSRINPLFQPNSKNRLIRNGVGISGQAVYFVLAEGPINFYDFARFLRDQLGCSSALYLDGSISAIKVPGTSIIGDGFFSAILAVVR
jgi:uncharacterized protein YigE (DUF2233 family)